MHETPNEIGPATGEMTAAIEAVLMAATDPIEVAELAQLLEISAARVVELCSQLALEYARDGRGFVLVRVAGGYRFQTHPDLAAYVERFVLEGQSARLSGPSLETLAIIAYKQPISRAQLSAIRGVNVEATLRTLVQRGYVEEIGHEPTLGSPALFGTTSVFLEKLGIDSLGDLPPLADFIPEANLVEALERGLQVREPDANEALDDDTAGAGTGTGTAVPTPTETAALVAVEKTDVVDLLREPTVHHHVAVEPVAADLADGIDAD
jgi:segregation and condensation protein B